MIKRTILTAGVTGLAVLAGSLAVQADARGHGGERGAFGGPRMDFGTLDTDGDGKVTPEEMQAAAAARFTAADADGDGTITTEELVAHMEAREDERRAERRQRMAERMLERADDDGDGALSVEELMPPERTQTRMFDRLDSDGDGAISEEEFAQMRQHREGGRKGWGRDGDRGEHKMQRKFD